ncbi:hypothetical protein VPH35_026562 [Triticum aestivum]
MVVVSRVAGGLARALLFGVFGAAGTVVGAAYGLLSGFVDEEDGFMQGTLLGALAGALMSLDLAHSILAIWCRRNHHDHCSPLDASAGRIKRTVGAIVKLRLLSTGGHHCRWWHWRHWRLLPHLLQEFEAGGEREGRRLPACSHVFHLECIRSWLLRKPHCPMCRHAVHF